MQIILRFFLALAVTGLPALAGAEQATCGGASVAVRAPSLALARSVCTGVDKTMLLLEQCGLGLSGPVRITVADDLPNLSHACFGYYDCDSGRILVRSPDSIADVSAESDLYLGLDPQVVFESIIAHELAHAAFAHVACEDAACLANHEYVAYAIQMWSLPPSVRDGLVAAFGQDAPVEPMRLNALIAVMAPHKFAALAWQHFNEDGHGCGFVQDLATGRTSLEIVWE